MEKIQALSPFGSIESSCTLNRRFLMCLLSFALVRRNMILKTSSVIEYQLLKRAFMRGIRRTRP